MRASVLGCRWCLLKADFSPLQGKEGTPGSPRECHPWVRVASAGEFAVASGRCPRGLARVFPRTAQGKLHRGLFAAPRGSFLPALLPGGSASLQDLVAVDQRLINVPDCSAPRQSPVRVHPVGPDGARSGLSKPGVVIPGRATTIL